MSRLVFIVGDIDNPHPVSRIGEFVRAGFDVEVLAFKKREYDKEGTLGFPVKIVGEIVAGGYKEKVKSYSPALKKYLDKKTLYFIFGLEQVMAAVKACPGLRYVYEESDLVHTYYPRAILPLEIADKFLIRRSKLSVFTSEGFAEYHYGSRRKPSNVIIVPNRLNKMILNHPACPKVPSDKLRFAFVGYPRFDSVLNFIDVFCRNFPDKEFHIWGGPVSEEFQALDKYPNCFIHGRFSNPVDLPGIYSKTDVVLCTYDNVYANVRYAEPNKIYEAIYFETPIIVSENTFLGRKVESMGIGYTVNPLNEESVVKLVKSISADSILAKKKACAAIDKEETIDVNTEMIERIKSIV